MNGLPPVTATVVRSVAGQRVGKHHIGRSERG
jgi:hypothetical protein